MGTFAGRVVRRPRCLKLFVWIQPRSSSVQINREETWAYKCKARIMLNPKGSVVQRA